MTQQPNDKRASPNEVAARLNSVLLKVSKDLRSQGKVSESDVVELESLDSVLDGLRTYTALRAKRWALAATSLLFVMLVIGLLVPQSQTTFSAIATSSSIMVRPAGIMMIGGLRLRRLRIAGADSSADPRGTHLAPAGTGNAIEFSDEYVLQALETPIDADLVVDFDATSRVLHMHVECTSIDACASGRLILFSKQASAAGRNRSGFDPIVARFVDSSVEISFLVVAPLPVTVARDVDIGRVSYLNVFAPRRPIEPFDLNWSGLRAAQVRLPEVDRTVSLGDGEWFDAQGSRMRLARLDVTDSGMFSVLRGTASRINSGGGTRTASMKPSSLDVFVSKYSKSAQVGWGLCALLVVISAKAASAIWGRA